MAKKQTPKKQPNKVRKAVSGFWQKNWFALLLVVVLLGVLAFIGVNKLIIYNQKKQFDQAEKSLDTLYTDIVKNVGQPTSVNKDNHCSYQSTAWGNGDRGCSVGVDAYYDNISNKQEAIATARNIESRLENISYVSILRKLSENEDTYVKPGNYSSSDDIKFKDQNLKCYVSYVLDKKELYSENATLRVSMNCYGDAKAEFYPVKD